MPHFSVPRCLGRQAGHYWFPAIHLLAPDALACLIPTVPDVGESRWSSRLLFSSDATAWKDLGEVPYGSASCRLDGELLVLPYEFWPDRDRRDAISRGVSLHYQEGGKLAWAERDITVRGFPRAIADYVNGKAFLLASGDDVQTLTDGSLFTTLYGKLDGDRKYSLFAVVSLDGGLNWRYRATVATSRGMRGVQEGPSEAATVRLDDGSLLCIYRVDSGEAFAFGRSLSRDEGQTWTRLRPMKGKGSVKPQLVRLEDGTILLSGGRPGIYLWVCRDGMGRRWKRFDLAAHHDRNSSAPDRFAAFPPGGDESPAASTCYTSMRRTGPQEILIAYERLGNGWKGAPGPHGEEDAVYCLDITVENIRTPAMTKKS